MKKSIAAVLVLIIGLVCLAACAEQKTRHAFFKTAEPEMSGCLAGALDLGELRDAGQKKMEIVVQKAELLREMSEMVERMEIMGNQAYIESIPAMSSGTKIEVDRLSTEQLSQLFYQEIIEPGDCVYERVNGCSYRENPNIALSRLRYLRVLYFGFDEQTHVGEMIVNAEIAEDVLDILQKLYEARYPIERMQLVDDYQADDNASMAANNSSAFNYRFIASTTKLSNHSWGKAVDINPLYNPYIYTAAGQLHVDPEGSEAYADRSGDCPYMIDHEDLCCQLFLEHGFTWGGDWGSRKDYQHFEKE